MNIDISGARILYTVPIDFPFLGRIEISETIAVSWLVMFIITFTCIWLTRGLRETNINKKQAFAEMLVDMAHNFVIGNMGEKFRYMIPFVAALFSTSLISNLISLVGFRSPTADLSTEAAWAVVVFIMITKQKIKSAGLGGYLKGFTTPTARSQALREVALTSRLTRKRICGSRRRTLSPKNTITALRTFLPKSSNPNTKKSLRRPASNISTR